MEFTDFFIAVVTPATMNVEFGYAGGSHPI